MSDHIPELTRNADGTLPARAWPGLYPMYYVTRDGLTVCPKCANREIDDAQAVIAGNANYEDAHLYCDDCGARIPSAYGEPA